MYVLTDMVQEGSGPFSFGVQRDGIDTGDHTSWRRYSHGLRVILISIYLFCFPSAPRNGTDSVHRVEGIVREDI